MLTTIGLTIPFTGLKKQYSNLREELLSVTDEVLYSGQLMNGNWTTEFENWLAKKNGVEYAVTVHSGTCALEVLADYYKSKIWMSQDNPPVVVCPSFTFPATVNAFVRSGWEVVLCDTDNYGVLDINKIPVKHCDAIVMVGLYGAGVTDRLRRLKQHFPEAIIIEDGAQHWLAENCERVSDSTAISFDPMKNLPANGNGGAIVTDDRELANYANEWKNNGKPAHRRIGTNSRMSELDCAHMMVKTRYIDQWQSRRQDIAQFWIEQLAGTEYKVLVEDQSKHALHKFVICTENRDKVKKRLAVRKIDTKIHYEEPLHEKGYYRVLDGPDLMSISSVLARSVLSLPIYPELTDLEVEYIIEQLTGLNDD